MRNFDFRSASYIGILNKASPPDFEDTHYYFSQSPQLSTTFTSYSIHHHPPLLLIFTPMTPFISICIPAYQRPQYLKRLLDSICIQTYNNFEVIVTDDSPDDTVEKLGTEYSSLLPLRYYHNPKALGTPANWNKAISMAKGTWIKLMHDDDWFADKDALEQFAACAQKNQEAFIFSAYANVYENTGRQRMIFPEKFRLKQLCKNPASILSKNIIGHPSTTLYRNNGDFVYDEHLKWLVDVEMYIRMLQKKEAVYIPQPLVKIGMSDSQVTAQVKTVPEVEIPEHLYFLNKTGTGILKNILAYDYFWRFIRNFNIRTTGYFQRYDQKNTAPQILNRMIGFQRKIPRRLIQIGIISKSLMLLHYLSNKKYLK